MTLIAAFAIQAIKILDSSESDDSSDEEDEYLITYANKKIIIPRARCKNYMETVALYKQRIQETFSISKIYKFYIYYMRNILNLLIN